MSEWKHIVSEWLAEYAALQPHEIKSFAAEHEHNHEIASAVFSLLHSDTELSGTPLQLPVKDEQYEQILEEVCTQLFSFYRSKEIELQRFTLQFVPTLIFNYLSLVAQQINNKVCRCMETLLIGIYNIEVVDDNGKPKVISFRLPSLAQASIYHEPLSLDSQFLTESALRRWEECNTKLISWGPLPQVETLNEENRLNVMSALLFIYNRQIYFLQKIAIRHFCLASSRIVTQGFKKTNRQITTSTAKQLQRIPVSPRFLIELAESLYYAMYNDFYAIALQAVKDIDFRAQYELLPDVMIITSAVLYPIENSIGPPNECHCPMGLGVELSPAANTVTMSKSMITNASFRTKKLPDDIPIQVGQVVPTESNDALTSITEEGETDSSIQRGAGIRTSKPKFPGLGKKRDSKDKSSEKKVTLKDSSKALWNTLSGGGDMVDGRGTREGSDPNGSSKDEQSMTSATENSDSRSQTTDSLEMETTSRFTAMQVSSV